MSAPQTDGARSADGLTRRFDTALTRLLPANAAALLVAFSGGADSVALLSLAAAFARTKGLALYALHLHHGIRGAEADRDAQFCQAFCAHHAIAFIRKDRDIPTLAKESGEGLEDCARRVRYAVLNAEAQRLETLLHAASPAQADRACRCMILTAHHADDQLETLLLRLIRGSGTHGMRGILSQNGRILRPLLAFPKADLLAYCNENALPFVTDSTNDDPQYARNYLRQTVTPALRRLNPRASLAAVRLADAMARDDAYFASEVAKIPVSPPRALFQTLPDALAVRVLAREFAAASAAPLSFAQNEALLTFAKTAKTGAALSLSGATVYADADALRFVPVKERSGSAQTDVSNAMIPVFWDTLQPLARGGMLFLSKSEKESAAVQNVYNLAIRTEMNSATIDLAFYTRYRQPGDTVLCGRLHKSCKNLMQQAKIPARMRSSLPFLCNAAGEILWIPGVCRADMALPKEAARIFAVYIPANS